MKKHNHKKRVPAKKSKKKVTRYYRPKEYLEGSPAYQCMQNWSYIK